MKACCDSCEHCNRTRRNEHGMLRCERFSRWVHRLDEACGGFRDRNADYYEKLFAAQKEAHHDKTV